MAVKRATQASRGKENQEEAGARLASTEKFADRCPTLEWETFVSLLGEFQSHGCELEAFVKEPSRIPLEPVKSCRERAKRVVDAVRAASGYQFKSVHPIASASDDLLLQSYRSLQNGTYVFYCAQLEGEETKNKKINNEKKRRPRMKMERFKCSGWLRITVVDGDPSTVKVRLVHSRSHPAYTDISLPDATAQLIREMRDSTAAKVRRKSGLSGTALTPKVRFGALSSLRIQM